MRDDLFQVIETIKADYAITGSIIYGSGKDFCAGADLTEFGTAPSQSIARTIRWERDLWSLFLNNPKPMIAAVHGNCIGSGFEIALLCDVIIASYNARFSMPEARLGLIAAAGGTQTLPRSVGPSKAISIFSSPDSITSQQAHSMGIVSKVVSIKRLMDSARDQATYLSNLRPELIAACKFAVNRGCSLPLNQGLLAETRSALRLMKTQ
jgi:enoyl-CoA hydratase/carnithine racemase